ncbi:cupin domain-containing protein [Psychrilyobacter sp.]|uniref:cupin domain-containing protein n=1 Tax=Psychrilyobacter sp. TaxID=2586924 RepID=UPI003018B819
MIIKECDTKKGTNEKPRGGHGLIHGMQYLVGDEITNKIKIVMANDLEIGAMIGEHTHTDDEEFYYIISGQGSVIDDGMVKKVSAGDLIYTGSGHSHSLENIGDTKLKFLAIIVEK